MQTQLNRCLGCCCAVSRRHQLSRAWNSKLCPVKETSAITSVEIKAWTRPVLTVPLQIQGHHPVLSRGDVGSTPLFRAGTAARSAGTMMHEHVSTAVATPAGTPHLAKLPHQVNQPVVINAAAVDPLALVGDHARHLLTQARLGQTCHAHSTACRDEVMAAFTPGHERLQATSLRHRADIAAAEPAVAVCGVWPALAWMWQMAQCASCSAQGNTLNREMMQSCAGPSFEQQRQTMLHKWLPAESVLMVAAAVAGRSVN